MSSPFNFFLRQRPTIETSISQDNVPESRRGSDTLLLEIRNEFPQAMQQRRYDSKRFVPRDSLEGIWTEQRLREFAQQKECFHEQDIPHIRACLLQTISILVQIGWDRWQDFRTIFLEREDHTDKYIRNYDLQLLEDKTFFGDAVWAGLFLDNRYIFCPLDIEEDMDEKYSEKWRVPFLDGDITGATGSSSSSEIGRGSFGYVTKETIAVRHLRFNERTTFTTNNCFARKRVFNHGDFDREKENLIKIKNEPRMNSHPNIMRLFAAIAIGSEFNFIFELANMNLRQLLEEPAGRFTLCDLIGESCNLASALAFLHEGMFPPLVVYHMDLKPKNILVVFKGPNMTGVGTWKISDFGVSTVATPESPPLDTSVGSFSFPDSKMRQGPYQPPEASNESYMSTKSDVWSLGCVLVRLIAYGIAGRSGLIGLDAKFKKSDDSTGDYQHNFFYRDNPPRLNPHVRRWLEDLPKHQNAQLPLEVRKDFRNLLLNHMLQIDRSKRSTASRVHGALLPIRDTLLRDPSTSDLEGLSDSKSMSPEGPSSAGPGNRLSTHLIVDVIHGGDLDWLKTSLNQNVDIETPSRGQKGEHPLERPLIHAIQKPSADTVKILLRFREALDIESPDSRGNTPLYCAIDVGDGKIVEQLLPAGVNVNAPSTGGLTPLMKATIEGHIEMEQNYFDDDKSLWTSNDETTAKRR
ncbi:kinase-like domain-containing protein [Aspergillus germanicus]